MMAAQSEHEHPGTGATSFLFTKYQNVEVFMFAFAILIFLSFGSVEGFNTKNQRCTYSKDKTCKPALTNAIFSTVSFLLGAITSVVSGFFGMKIVTYANAKTTSEARKGVGKAVITAFRSSAVMGFLLAANGLLVLYIAINLFKLHYGQDWEGLFEAITGYGLVIGFVIEYYANNTYSHVQDVADLCRTGLATNVIFGLALGYKSVIIPIFAIAISDKAGGIAGMAGMSHRIRDRTDALDVAGNTTAAIRKGFAIGLAALVSLTLLVAFVSRALISTVGDKLKLQFAHMNFEDKIRFEGAGSDRMRKLWHLGWRTYSRHARIVRS